jgi:hypothetical protein
MSLTPLTSPTPYLTPAQFLTRYDQRFIGELCSDSGSPVSPANLLTDPNLAAALADASSFFESCVRVGGRYEPADLNALLAAGGVGGNLIQRLVADLTLQYLRRRRGMNEDENMVAKDTYMTLKKLREGEQGLGFVEADEAGDMQVQVIYDSDRNRADLITQNSRFWGTRWDQLCNWW